MTTSDDLTEAHVFLTRYLDSDDFVKLGETEELGRVVLATKNIAVGSKIIRESPIMVWKHGQFVDFYNKFKELPDKDKDGILDMYSFPLDSPQVLSNKASILQAAWLCGVEITLAMKLFSICSANAHEYIGRDNESYREVVSYSPRVHSGQAALFLFASKVPHSCNPNSAYTSQTKYGKLEYKVIRDIIEGQIVSFSYLDDLWETPTHLRRKKLQNERSFLCNCNRCVDTDHLRKMQCESCRGSLLCSYDTKQVPSWHCEKCQGITDRASCEKREAEIEETNRSYDMKMMMGGIHSFPLKALESHIQKAEKILHPHHYLVIQALNSYIRLCASKAADIESVPTYMRATILARVAQNFGDPKQMRSKAASAAFQKVLKIECIASGCDGQNHGRDEIIHPVQYQSAVTMFHACQDLLSCPPAMWPKSARKMVHRYLPPMKLQFGESDEDVASIEQKLLGGASRPGFAESFSLLTIDRDRAAQADVESASNDTASPMIGDSNCTRSKGNKGKGKKKRGGGSTKKKKKRG